MQVDEDDRGGTGQHRDLQRPHADRRRVEFGKKPTDEAPQREVSESHRQALAVHQCHAGYKADLPKTEDGHRHKDERDENSLALFGVGGPKLKKCQPGLPRYFSAFPYNSPRQTQWTPCLRLSRTVVESGCLFVCVL